MQGPKEYMEARKTDFSLQIAVLNRLGRLLADHGRLSGAIRAHGGAFTVDAGDEEAVQCLVVSLLASGDVESARSLLESSDLVRAKSVGIEDTERLVRQWVEEEPGSSLLHVALASLVAALGEIDEAISLLRTAVGLDGRYAQAWAELGALLLVQGDLGSAERALCTAVTLRPDDRSARRHLAMTLGRRGKVQEALEEFDALIAEDPDDGDVLTDRAVLLLTVNEADRAADDLSRAVRIDPGLDRARFYSAVTAIELGRRGEGARELEEIAGGSGSFAMRAEECLHRLQDGVDRT